MPAEFQSHILIDLVQTKNKVFKWHTYCIHWSALLFTSFLHAMEMTWNIKTKSHDKWKCICIDYSMVPRTSCFLGDHISTSRPHKYLHAFDLALLTLTLWYKYGIKYTLLANKYMDICHIPNKQTSSDTVPFFAVCVTNIDYCHLLVQNVFPLT